MKSCYMCPLLVKEIHSPTRIGIYSMTVRAVFYIYNIVYIVSLLIQVMVLSISLDTFYSNKNYGARKI